MHLRVAPKLPSLNPERTNKYCEGTEGETDADIYLPHAPLGME